MMLAGMLPLANAAVARAACADGPADLEQAVAASPVVFVGRATEVSTDRHSVAVTVLSVWKGPDLPVTIEVVGGFAGDPELRRYNRGAVYLFMPTNRSEPFVDDVCSATRPYSGPALVIPPYLSEAAGAEKARMPVGAEEVEAEASAMTPIAIGVLLLLTVLGLLGFYRRALRVDPVRVSAASGKPLFKPVRKRRRQSKVGTFTSTGSRAARRHAKPGATWKDD
jgi:hypothetical protein